MAAEPRERSGTRTFLIIWFGQLISLIGSGLTSFALGVYIYNRTGAATQLALSLVAASVPNLVCCRSPAPWSIAGTGGGC